MGPADIRMGSLVQLFVQDPLWAEAQMTQQLQVFSPLPTVSRYLFSVHRPPSPFFPRYFFREVISDVRCW
jgi:hypothetical protein